VSYLGWFGILLGFVLGIRMAIRKRPGPVEIAAASAGLMGVAVSSLRFYEDPFGYCRPFASLFVVLGLHAIARRAWVTALPILLVDLHLGLQVGSKALGILRAVFS